jgi:hypothetical protein
VNGYSTNRDSSMIVKNVSLHVNRLTCQRVATSNMVAY